MAATDRFSNFSSGLTAPLTALEAVTPDDGADLAQVTRAIHIGTAGNMRVTAKDGQVVTLVNLAQGWHPIRACRIHVTGTSAADIVAGW